MKLDLHFTVVRCIASSLNPIMKGEGCRETTSLTPQQRKHQSREARFRV